MSLPLLIPNKSLQFVNLPKDNDPDSFLNNNQLISIFFNSKPEQKKIENQEEKSGQEFQSVTKFLKKMIICI